MVSLISSMIQRLDRLELVRSVCSSVKVWNTSCFFLVGGDGRSFAGMHSALTLWWKACQQTFLSNLFIVLKFGYGVLAWLCPPKYFLSILISLHYYVWVCSMLVGFLCQTFLRPISEQREWLRRMTLKSALVDGHLHEQCLVCLQPARNLIPGQTLAIGYGRSRVALGRSNSFKLQQTPAFKWVDVCQLSRSRLSVQIKWSTSVW
jgi:hypothetical protein